VGAAVNWSNPALWLAVAAVIRAFTPDVVALIGKLPGRKQAQP